MDIEVFTFQDSLGDSVGDFKTQDIEEAKVYAKENNLCVIANVYVWSDSEPVENMDFTNKNKKT